MGMQQQTDEKVKIEAKAATPNILTAQLRSFKFELIFEKQKIVNCKPTYRVLRISRLLHVRNETTFGILRNVCLFAK